jgi:acyl-CoA synthetase (AMP-forming)/AMP-acid ligase II
MKDIVQVFTELEEKKIQSKLFAQLENNYTYADLTNAVSRMASVFQQNGLQQGDRVILSSKDNYAVGVTFLACLRNGLTAVLLDPDVGPRRAGE